MRPGTRHSDEARARMRQGRQALLSDPGYLKKVREHAETPEARQRHKEKLRLYWHKRRVEGLCANCAKGQCLLCDGGECKCRCADELDRPHTPEVKQ